MIPPGFEVNFDGIAGPSHNFAGLSKDNLASVKNRFAPSNPKLAALQGLEKMKLLTTLGIRQAVIPPHERPHIPTLRALGYSGTDKAIPEKVYKEMPEVLLLASSAASMWSANCATVTPSIDSTDQKVHITPANFYNTAHRSIETGFNEILLKKIFPSDIYFHHHPPLPFGKIFADEGCANHCHFSATLNRTGVHLFVYGSRSESLDPELKIRQTLQASEAIARSHKLFPERTVFAQQSLVAIKSGVFHNDLISTGNNDLFLLHELAFADTEQFIKKITSKVRKHCETELQIIVVPSKAVPLNVAVKSYLFNSQLIKLPGTGNEFSLITPIECSRSPEVSHYLDNLTKDPDNNLRDVHFVDVSQSMRNGGGPACQRLRTVLTPNEIEAVHPHVFLTDRLYARLIKWIEKHYRDKLEVADLADPDLVEETQAALDELTRILDLGNIYSFQQ